MADEECNLAKSNKGIISQEGKPNRKPFTKVMITTAPKLPF